MYKIRRYEQKQPLLNIGFSKSVVNISNIMLEGDHILLNNFSPIFHLGTPWKYQKPRGFSDDLTGYRNETLASNGLKKQMENL